MRIKKDNVNELYYKINYIKNELYYMNKLLSNGSGLTCFLFLPKTPWVIAFHTISQTLFWEGRDNILFLTGQKIDVWNR